MALPLYLAMTREEFEPHPLPPHPAYMACHFSAYGKGLQDLPAHLPQGSMLILNDRIPPWKQDPQLVAAELSQTAEQLGCSAVLMDFQQAENPHLKAIVQQVCQVLTVPCAATEPYAGEASCGVLITAPLPNQPLSTKISNWEGRELWLEAVPETVRYTITRDASQLQRCEEPASDFPHHDQRLCCRYQIEVKTDHAVITLCRTREDLQKLLAQAETLGFTRAVGLYQQLGNMAAPDDG
jgi:hypothetical protein